MRGNPPGCPDAPPDQGHGGGASGPADQDTRFQEPLFAARVIYDLLFFFMVIIIVLNLIFGVIIDTFADLRSEKQKKEEILKTTCFICGECPGQRGQDVGGWGLGGRRVIEHHLK